MIQLTLTDEQAKVVSDACEFYARIRLGQFNEIIWNREMQQSISDRNYFDRVEVVEQLLMTARALFYPDLGAHKGSSYGVGKYPDADTAFNVHQVLRHELGDKREPLGHTDMPKCKKVKETENEQD